MLSNRVMFGVTRQGTIIGDLPIGSRLKFGSYLSTPIIWRVVDINHTDYPSNSVTLASDGLIAPKEFDAKEPNHPYSDIKNFGNNRYLYSNLRQWLNKSGPSWYLSQHVYDAPPSYSTENGFLGGFTPSEISGILDTTLIVAKNTYNEGGGSETVVDKIFLASMAEVGLGATNGIFEGSVLSYFTTNASRVAKYSGSAYQWWSRSPYVTLGREYMSISTSGAITNGSAYIGVGAVRPFCNVKANSLVSDEVDADGCYIYL